VIVQNIMPTGTAVLNAADPIVAAMARHSPGPVTFFAADRGHPVMATHLAQGKRAIYVDQNCIVAAEGTAQHRIALDDVPLTHGGAISFQVENVMAAVAAAWGLGVDWETIRHGLASFVNDSDNAQGRFNVFSYRGATVIADYGHNPDAIAALVRAVDALPAKRRSVVISGAFDDVLLYQDQCQRGRADGEVLALLREGLSDAKRASAIDEIRGEFLAIDTAMDRLCEGDLCLILVDQVEEALAHIEARIAKE
jgi:cyanophycin synthetase